MLLAGLLLLGVGAGIAVGFAAARAAHRYETPIVVEPIYSSEDLADMIIGRAVREGRYADPPSFGAEQLHIWHLGSHQFRVLGPFPQSRVGLQDLHRALTQRAHEEIRRAVTGG